MPLITIRRLPAMGLALALVLLEIAVVRYPGGYNGPRHFISTLFAGTTTSGEPNPSRPFAIAGIFFFYTSMALLFQLTSSKASSRFHKKTIQIGGIGSMVYGFLAVTRLHDLMVTIALGFFLTAMIAALN